MRNKNVENFYLFTERKSTEDLEQNQYVNISPLDDNSKKESKDTINCNYLDNNIIISEKIDAEIINENYENNNEYNFNIKELHGGVNNEKEYNIKFIKNNFMKEKKNDNGNNNNNNKSTIEKNFEYDDINKIIDKKKDNVKNEIDKNNNNINNNNSSNNNNNKRNNKYDLTLNNNINNITTNQNKIIENPQMPLTFISNIYNINNNHFKDFQANPIINQGMFNYYQNININPFINYYSNYQAAYYYQQLYNKNKNQFQNDSFNPINNQNNNNIINPNNNKINIHISTLSNNNNIKTDIHSIHMNNNNMNHNNNEIDNKSKTNLSNTNDNTNQQMIIKNYSEYSDEEILNSAISLIKDQYGCLFMQEKIKGNNYFANELLFPRIKYYLKELCCDCFGNYFLQLMISILSFDNINKFFDMTQNEFTEICISPHGTRVIQKIIDKISATPLLMNRFIYNLNSKDLGVIFKSPYGNHSIQKFLEITHSSEYSNFIFIYIYNNFLDITNSKHGVCVVQKCINEGDEKQRNKLYELILNNFNNIIKNEFGNYLIHYILINTKTEKKFKEILPIILKIEENMIELCQSKYSANVIEKSFENSENIIRDHILNSLIKNNSENIIDILLDNYGIYVIQKALKLKNSEHKNKLVEIINNKEKELKSINFGDYKYKNILKIINSHKELIEILSKYIKINNNKQNNNENKEKNENNERDKNNEDNNENIQIIKGEENKNEYYNYNKGGNKRRRKYFREYNNEF